MESFIFCVVYFGMKPDSTYCLNLLRHLKNYIYFLEKNPKALPNPKPKTKKNYPKKVSFTFPNKKKSLYLWRSANQS